MATTRSSYPPRIRLNEQEAELLLRLLWDERQSVLHKRIIARDRGEELRPYQHSLAVIRNIYDEIMILVDERGWHVGQHQSDDASDRSWYPMRAIHGAGQ